MAKKLKSHSGALKRFKITKKDKVLSSKQCNNHLLTNKGKNNKKILIWKRGYWCCCEDVEKFTSL